MVKIAFSSPLAGKANKDTQSLVPEQDPEVATHGIDSHRSTGHCLLTLLGVAFILAGLIVGGACMYKFFVPRHKVYEGQMSFVDDVAEPYYLPVSEEADIREDDNVAIINVPVPSFSEGDSAAIVHDFDKLLTAYLDLQIQKCYIINLNTSIVLPPRNLLDLFMKLASGSYLPQTYLVSEELVVTEKIDDLSELGIFIYQHCVGRETYRLQRRDQIIGMQKRSVETCRSVYHFENNYVVHTTICEL